MNFGLKSGAQKSNDHGGTAQPTPASLMADETMPWGSRPSPKPEHFELTLIDNEITLAESEQAAANDRRRDADQALNSARAEIAALGGQPQPGNFETAKAWRAALDSWEFDHAKLAPRLAPLEARLAEAIEDLRLPTDRLADLKINRQRAICENTLADLDGAAKFLVDKIRDYHAALYTIDGTRRQGLYVNEKAMLIKSFVAQNFGDFERIEVALVAPFN